MDAQERKAEQMGMAGTEITVGNSIVLDRSDAWAATRFGLKRNKRIEGGMKRKEGVQSLGVQVYDLYEVGRDGLPRVLAFLHDQEISYEVL